MSGTSGPENQTWDTPNPHPILLPDEIHLWRVRLDGAGYQDDRLAAVLSGEEQDRAQRFHFEQHRNRFIRTHGISRMILSIYTGIDASRLAFKTGARGKPYLAPGQPRQLFFNLSHSGDLMVLGISGALDLGVDVEIINEQVEWKQIAGNYFNPLEMEEITGLSTRSAQLRAFYRVWTVKEAYLKAKGDGLAGGLAQVVVNLEQDDREIFKALPGGENEKRRWQAVTFRPAAGACGAVVAQRGQSPWKIIQYHWTG